MRNLFENKTFKRGTYITGGAAALILAGLAHHNANDVMDIGKDGCVQVATFLDATDTDSSTEDLVVEVVDENGTTTQVIVNTTEGTKPDSSTETSEGSGSATSGEKPNSTNGEGNSSEGGNSGSATTEAPSTQPSGGNSGEKPQTTETPNNEDTKPSTPTTEETKPEVPSTTETPTTEEHSECQHDWIGVRETIHHDAVYETQTVCVQEAYDEPVYVWHDFCNGCGADLDLMFPDGHYTPHTTVCQGGSTYHADKILVDTIHHEAVYETKEVCVQEAWDEIVTHTVCSICGYQLN